MSTWTTHTRGAATSTPGRALIVADLRAFLADCEAAGLSDDCKVSVSSFSSSGSKGETVTLRASEPYDPYEVLSAP